MTESANSTTPGSDDELEKLVLEANVAFEEACRTRHAKGEEEYGHNTFLTAPTIEMGLEELADLCNYVRYTYIRLYLFNKAMAKHSQEYDKTLKGRNQDGFIPLGEMFGRH
jgi:hypothetical protein